MVLTDDCDYFAVRYEKWMIMFLISKKHRLLRICIILLVVMFLSFCESAFAEDSNDVSEQ